MPDFGDDVSFVTTSSLLQGISPLWRQVVTDLSGQTLTVLDKLASGRVVTPLLDAPLVGIFDVPSDNPEVNIPAPNPDGEPFVSEGTRLVYWLRRERETPPYYYPRASTIVMLVEDTAEQDNAVTHVTCFDPWQYLYYLPIMNADGELPKTNVGVSFDESRPSYIVPQLLKFYLDGSDSTAPDAAQLCFIDTGPDFTGTPIWGGTYEDPMVEIDVNFPQGWTIGQAFDKLIAMGVCDIILTPVYDPIDRPGILCDLSVVTQAGVERDEAIFAWDRPGRNLSAISRTIDGSTRANQVKIYAGTGGGSPEGGAVPIQSDAASIAKFGEYWALQNASGYKADVATDLAINMLRYRKTGRRIVNLTPAPERAPRPFQDYGLGDIIIPSASTNFRESIPPSADEPDPEKMRIYGFPLAIDDDALETPQAMLLSPQPGGGA